MAKTTTSQTQSQPKDLKKIRKELYQLRTFEIQNLWQRSIFLVTFIVILLTGYGYLIEKLLFEYDKWATDNGLRLMIAHAVCATLAFLGSIFSVIWIMMAKGSKAWYEIHERRIRKVEKEIRFRKKYKMKPGAPWNIDDSLFSCEPGSYSVSRINILLGQILLIAWRTACYMHIAFIIWEILISPHDTSDCSSNLTRFLITILSIILICAQHHLPSRLKSIVHSHGIISREEEKAKKKKKKKKNQPSTNTTSSNAQDSQPSPTTGQPQTQDSSPCASSSNAPAPQPSTSTE